MKMKASEFINRVLFFSAAASLAACGESQMPIGAPSATIAALATSPPVGLLGPSPCGWLSPEAKRERRLIYVANGGEVLIFSERAHNPSRIGCIGRPFGSSHGIYVDRRGELYVTNGNDTVTAYARGSLTPSATYSTGSNGPMFPIVDRKGDLFVSTCCSGKVLEFLSGHSTPYRTLRTPGYEDDGIALDGKGNLYVAYRTSLYSGSIDQFAPGSSQGKSLGMLIVQPQGLVIASDGTILLVQTGPADGVYVFRPGSTTAAFKFSVGDTPVQLAITEQEHDLMVSAFGRVASGRIYEAPYPLSVSSHFHVKKAFYFWKDGHRRKPRFQIQGMALGNGQMF